MKSPFALSIVLLGIFVSVVMAADTRTDAGLTWILPSPADIKGLKTEDAPQQAKSDGLYELIDGGASVYLANGFKQALLQDYRSSAGTLYNVEVYELDTEANGKKVFSIKGGDPKKAGAICQGESLEDYYGLFWQGRFFITVTASDSSDEAKKQIKQIAKAVVKKIKSKDAVKK